MIIEQCRVADFIADYLSHIGITNAFLLPGGGAMYLVDAFGKHPGIEVTVCQHEQAVGIAAEACGRVQGNFGVAIVTTGPGATNIITPVAGSWIESIPLLVISGQAKRSDLIRNSGLRQKGVQEVDIVTIVKSITKYAVTIEKPEDIKSELQKAVYLLNEGRKGPVWLDVPLDVQAAIINPQSLTSYQEPLNENIDLQGDLFKVTELIKAAQRPIILAGHGIRIDNAAEAFRQFTELLQIPLVFTWNAMDLLPYDHPLYVGRPGVVALRAANFAVQNSDLIISIGCRIDNIITAFNPQGFAPEAKKIVVDIDQHELDKHAMHIDVKIRSGARAFITAMLMMTKGIFPSFDSWIQKCQDWKKRYTVNDGKPFEKAEYLSHYEFSDKVSDILPENTIITTGSSGLAVEVFYTVFRNKPGQRVFLTAGLGSMGYGLPAAIGACIAGKKERVIAVESDGSLQLNIQELATIRGYELPICLIVLNNDGYTSIKNTQKNYFNGRFVGTGKESGLWLPDLSGVADAYNMDYFIVRQNEDLKKVFQVALNKNTAVIIDVKLNPNEILSPKVAAMSQADGTLISMPLEDMSPMLPIEILGKEMKTPIMSVSYTARGLNEENISG